MGNALLILACAAMTLRHALKRQLIAHRRWALRLFVVVSGVWFFRIGMAFWISVSGGFDPASFDALSLTLSIGQCLVPLLALEVYLRACDHGGSVRRCACAAGLVAVTALMGYGVWRAANGMWLPHLV